MPKQAQACLNKAIPASLRGGNSTLGASIRPRPDDTEDMDAEIDEDDLVGRLVRDAEERQSARQRIDGGLDLWPRGIPWRLIIFLAVIVWYLER